jgi:hypothetical protein
MSKDNKEVMNFMGYKVSDMAREGLLEVIKYLEWENGSFKSNDIKEPPAIDSDKCSLKEEPLPRKEVISIQPGDVVVLTCKCDCTEKQAEAIRLEFKTLFPNNETVLLAGGATLEVYREQVKDG